MRSGIWVVLALGLGLSTSAVLAAPPTLGGGWYNIGYSYQTAPAPTAPAPVPMGEMSAGGCGDCSFGCCESVWDGYCGARGLHKCGLHKCCPPKCCGKKCLGGHHLRGGVWGGAPVWSEGCCGSGASSCCGNGGSGGSYPIMGPSPNSPVAPAPTPAAPVPAAPKRATMIPSPNSSVYTY